MLVIHPKDETTDFLRTLYEGMEGVELHTGEESRNRLASRLYHLPAGEPVMLLGHGNPDGLYRREGDEYRCYVGQSMGHFLRRHPVIGIWCHSLLFARKNGLHGLFSGMIISEMDEAREYQLLTTAEEIEAENERFASTLRLLLETGIRMELIPLFMEDAAGGGSDLREFNYKSLFYL